MFRKGFWTCGFLDHAKLPYFWKPLAWPMCGGSTMSKNRRVDRGFLVLTFFLITLNMVPRWTNVQSRIVSSTFIFLNMLMGMKMDASSFFPVDHIARRYSHRDTTPSLYPTKHSGQPNTKMHIILISIAPRRCDALATPRPAGLLGAWVCRSGG